MKKPTHSKGWGGKRDGAGQKTLSPDGEKVQSHTVMLFVHQWNYCLEHKSASSFISNLVLKYQQSDENTSFSMEPLTTNDGDYKKFHIKMRDTLWHYCKEQGNGSALIRALIAADMESKGTEK